MIRFALVTAAELGEADSGRQRCVMRVPATRFAPSRAIDIDPDDAAKPRVTRSTVSAREPEHAAKGEKRASGPGAVRC